jgi:hypothetical protein
MIPSDEFNFISRKELRKDKQRKERKIWAEQRKNQREDSVMKRARKRSEE